MEAGRCDSGGVADEEPFISRTLRLRQCGGRAEARLAACLPSTVCSMLPSRIVRVATRYPERCCPGSGPDVRLLCSPYAPRSARRDSTRTLGAGVRTCGVRALQTVCVWPCCYSISCDLLETSSPTQRDDANHDDPTWTKHSPRGRVSDAKL